jgi:hypothetical protein
MKLPTIVRPYLPPVNDRCAASGIPKIRRAPLLDR